MRLRNVKNAKEIVNNCSFVIKNPADYKGKYNELIFQNNNPIHLEIGMGKGQFLIKMAKKYPEINFIGIEKYESVLCRAIEKIMDEPLDNLRIICADALEISEIFQKEIDILYLNFSDPWPKTRHAKRRLTSFVFLPIYDKIFKDYPTIIQKTDNKLLFASSIVSLSEYGYKIVECSLDLAHSDIPNETTEYEDKFSKMGETINYLKAIKK